MGDPVIRRVRRSIDEAKNRGGLRAGMPKVTIDAADAERLCIMAELFADTKSGQGADAMPVGIVRHRTDPRGDNPDAYVDWQFGGDVENMPDGTELYTQPQPAQEGSVSSRDDLIQCLLATRGQSEGVAADAILWLFSATTPQPEGDGWVKCSERLPTEADGDWDGQVIVLDDHGEMACTNWSVATRKIITHWKPTGLKRPQPPKEGE